jgi:predicted membrane chloride channel (bestrophin family)
MTTTTTTTDSPSPSARKDNPSGANDNKNFTYGYQGDNVTPPSSSRVKTAKKEVVSTSKNNNNNNNNNKKGDLRWEELQRIERRRRAILKVVEEPFWKTLFHWDGTVIRQIAKDNVLWLTLTIFIGVRIGARLGLPDFVASIPAGGDITTLGGFISFFLVFYVNQSHKRFFGLYNRSMACKGRIFDVATLARASLPPARAHRLVRYMNAAHAAGYVGLSEVYPQKSYFEPINEQLCLLTDAEKERIDDIDMDKGGSAYRELIVWAIMEVQSAKAEGLLDREHATLIRDLILKLRASMGQLYNAADLPIPFYYVHFICLLTVLYLPLFAVTTGIKAGTGDEAIWVVDIVAGLIVVLQSIFVIGLRILGQKISDPYGDDLVDLSVMFYVEFTWTQSNRILQSHGPPEPEPNPSTETELQRHRKTVGSAWDNGENGYGLGPVNTLDDDESEDYDYSAELSQLVDVTAAA